MSEGFRLYEELCRQFRLAGRCPARTRHLGQTFPYHRLRTEKMTEDEMAHFEARGNDVRAVWCTRAGGGRDRTLQRDFLSGGAPHPRAWRPDALGARGADIVRFVVRDGMAMAAGGTALGLGLALVAGKWLEPLLFQTSARDAVVLGGVGVGISIVAFTASVFPAVRASRVTPMTALRSD